MCKDTIIKQAFNVAEFLALSKDEQLNYQRDLKVKLDYVNVLNYAKEQAEERGREKGIKEGEQAGARRNQVKTVLNANYLGLSPQNISQITGLSETEVNAIISTKS